MVNTINKADTPPPFFYSTFERVGSKKATLRRLIDNGYLHCLYFRITGDSSVTVGTGRPEFRIMGMWLFFREQFPTEQLWTHLAETTPVLIGQKFYDDGRGMGSNALLGNLTPLQLRELLEFFERKPDHWSEISDEPFSYLQYAWGE